MRPEGWGKRGHTVVAAGIEPGDRVAIWAPNSAEWVIALLGLFEAGAVLVPINTRFKGDEAADILAGARRACPLVTVTDFLGTDYLALLDGADAELPTWRRSSSRRPGARANDVVGHFLAGANDAGRAEGSTARGIRPRAIRPTSCSPPARPACPRASS